MSDRGQSEEEEDLHVGVGVAGSGLTPSCTRRSSVPFSHRRCLILGRRTPRAAVRDRSGATQKLASNEGVQDGGCEQRRGVEQDEVREVVDEILVSRQAERTDGYRATVTQTAWNGRSQHQPRRTVSTQPSGLNRLNIYIFIRQMTAQLRK